MRLDDEAVFVTARSPGKVLRVAKADGSRIELGASSLPTSLAISDGDVYWCDEQNSSVYRASKLTSGTASSVATPKTCQELAHYGDQIFMTTYGGGSVHRVDSTRARRRSSRTCSSARRASPSAPAT